jgi:transcriptional regulator with XRE-family HTH domain
MPSKYTGPLDYRNAQTPDRKAAYYTPWCDLLSYHLARSTLTMDELAGAMGCARSLISHYVGGRVLPPTGKKLDAMIQAFHLDGVDKERFEEESLLANSPAQVRAIINSLRAQLREARRATH